jgi:hypothetical protein
MAKYPDLAAALDDGVEHYWLMDETTGTDVADLIGAWGARIYGDSYSGTDLTASEYDATAVTTPAGYGRYTGANWDGTSGDIQKLAAIRLNPSPIDPSFQSITLRIRYFHTSRVEDVRSSSYMELAHLGASNNFGIRIKVDNGNAYLAAGNEDSGSDIISDPFVVGQWHDVVIAGDSSGTGLYVNGTLVYSLAGSSNFLIYRPDSDANQDYSFFGAKPDGEYYLAGSPVDGVFQDACVWSRKFSPQEITDLQSDGTDEPLVTSTAPITYGATLDALLPITAEFSVLVNPARATLDSTFPIWVKISAFQDWISRLPPAQIQEFYRLVITGAQDGMEDFYIGRISSWQATSQAGGRSSYVQAVIPNAGQYLDGISARKNGELVIQKGFLLSNGSSEYGEIIRSGFDSLRYDRGPRALTATVSGYFKDTPLSSGTRTLTGIRSISVTGGKRRVRCDVDLFLQPGMTVTALDESFTADYINYNVSRADKFAEVSER